MTKEIRDIVGSGGGKGEQEQRTPVEAPNSLRSKAVVRILEVLSEGEIEGLVDGRNSIYLDETEASNYSTAAISHQLRTGLAYGLNTPVGGFPYQAASVTTVNTPLTNGNPVTKTVTDSDVDRISVTVSVPALRVVDFEDTGDTNPTSVTIRMWVNNIFFKDEVISGKCISTYQRTVYIDNLVALYGSAPWEVKLQRLTADSDSQFLSNATSWDAYGEYVDGDYEYPHTAYIALTVDSEEYGTRIPVRAYEVQGIKIQTPSNRTWDQGTDTVTYSGTWDGTFGAPEFCDNPAWVLYDILTNERYGLGLDDQYIDKWELFTIGAYCDQKVDYTLDGADLEERRFTFNGVIQTREEAYHVVSALAQAFRGMAYWATGLAAFAQDRPKDATRIVTAANVQNGLFNYEGSGLKARHTVALVTWNDPDDLGHLKTEIVENKDAIVRYGWNEIQVHAFGCTSRGQARRFGKWILDSEYYETEVVTYTAGWDHADTMPGEIVKIADPHYTAKRWGGRIVSATTGQIVIDEEIAFVPGNNYDVSLMTTSGTLMEEDLTNPAATTDTITINGTLPEAPQPHSVWVITEAAVEEPRPFRVLSNVETEPHKYTITALEYDANKFARVEEGIIFDAPPYSNLPTSVLTAPTNFQLEEYSYLEGAGTNQKFGVQMSWTPEDSRTQWYEIQKATLSGAWTPIGQVMDPYFVDKPVTSGTYDYRLRGVTAVTASEWVVYDNFQVIGTTVGIADILGLQIIGGGNTWGGTDVHFEWDPLVTTYSGVLRDYRIDILKTDDTLLRRLYTQPDTTQAVYTWAMNDEDNSGSPQRQIKVRVYARDLYYNVSQNPATRTFSNPAPDISGGAPALTAQFNQIKADWNAIKSTDSDLRSYEVYSDTNPSPTTLIEEVGPDTTKSYISNLNPDLTYYVKITPYDLFGVGVSSAVASTSPDRLPGEYTDIAVELTDDIIITDSLTNSGTITKRLYDYDTLSSGIYYPTTTGTNWVDYNLPVGELINRVVVWPDQDFKAYFRMTEADDTVTWVGAEGDHTLTSDGKLVNHASQAAAETNYWQVQASGTPPKDAAEFPTRTVAKECRMYMYQDDVNVRELVFERTVEAEQVVADRLSAFTATIGDIENGTIQSLDWGANTGSFFDLTSAGYIKMGGEDNPKFFWDGDTGILNISAVVTFEGGTTGYSGIADAPTTLSGINTYEYDHLVSVQEGADVTSENTAQDVTSISGVPAHHIANWARPGNTTVIDGGNIWVGSSLTLNEGGYLHLGNDNIHITTEGNHASMIVAEDGGVNSAGEPQDEKDYLILTDGNIQTHKWFNGAHRQFKQLNKVVVGVANNNQTVNLGYFPTQPSVMLSPSNLQSYDSQYSSQDQIFNLEVKSLTQNGAGEWLMTPRAELRTVSAAGTVNLYYTSPTVTADSTWASTGSTTTPANTQTVKLNASLYSVRTTTTQNQYYYRNMVWRGVYNGAYGPTKSTALGEFTGTGWVADTQTYTLLPGAYNLYIQGYGTGSSSTFSTGQVTETQYQTGTKAAHAVSDSVYTVDSNGLADTDQGTLNFTMTAPSAPAGTGWSLVEVEYRVWVDVAWCGQVSPFRTGWIRYYLISNDGIWGRYYINTSWDMAGDLKYDHGETVYTGRVAGLRWMHNLAGDTDCSVRETQNYYFTATKPHTSYDTSQALTLKVGAVWGWIYGEGEVTDSQLVGKYQRAAQWAASNNNKIRFDSYEYTLSTSTFLATGTINYMAIS